MIFTESELQELLKEWQEILRLQHWKIVLKTDRRYNLPEGSQGTISWKQEKLCAMIKILDPADWDPSSLIPQDMECTLVHELIHILFAPFAAQDDTPEDISQEQAIECLATALVGLKRRALSTSVEPERPEITE